jgi:hypothetical protein
VRPGTHIYDLIQLVSFEAKFDILENHCPFKTLDEDIRFCTNRYYVHPIVVGSVQQNDGIPSVCQRKTRLSMDDNLFS